MTYTCVIPGRGGSRRISRKNIREFHGKPIIGYSIALGLETCDRVIVSTEDAEIAAFARECGAEVHQRSFEMAKDEIGTQEVVKNVLDELKVARTSRILVLYPCAPLLLRTDVELALSLSEKQGYVVAVGTEPLRDAGVMYAGKCSLFRDYLPLYSDTTRLVTLPEDRVCDINLEDDWLRAEQMYATLHQLRRAEAQIDLEDARQGVVV